MFCGKSETSKPTETHSALCGACKRHSPKPIAAKRKIAAPAASAPSSRLLPYPEQSAANVAANNIRQKLIPHMPVSAAKHV
jgi:hypothetical protein